MTYYMEQFETQTVVKAQLICIKIMPVKSMVLFSIFTTVSQSKPWPAVQ